MKKVKLTILADELPFYYSIPTQTNEGYIKIINISKEYMLGNFEFIDITYEFEESALHAILGDFFHAGKISGIKSHYSYQPKPNATTNQNSI